MTGPLSQMVDAQPETGQIVTTQSSGTIAGRVAQELRLLSGRLDQAETALEILLDQQNVSRQTGALRALQELDIASQTVVALAEYLHAVSEIMPQKDQLDTETLLATVRLEAVARRLAGLSHTATDHASDILF